jgi:hypothetical protein
VTQVAVNGHRHNQSIVRKHLCNPVGPLDGDHRLLEPLVKACVKNLFRARKPIGISMHQGSWTVMKAGNDE